MTRNQEHTTQHWWWNYLYFIIYQRS